MVGLNKLKLAAVFKPEFLLDAARIDPVLKTLEITEGLGADIAICANPASITQEQAIESVRKKGRVILFGGLPEDKPFSSLNSNLIHYNELSVVGSFSSPSYMNVLALEAIKNRKITPKKYINKIVNLDYIVEGFKSAEKGSAQKVIVKPWS
jgi:L-iditol 2-dehydrogenase